MAGSRARKRHIAAISIAVGPDAVDQRDGQQYRKHHDPLDRKPLALLATHLLAGCCFRVRMDAVGIAPLGSMKMEYRLLAVAVLLVVPPALGWIGKALVGGVDLRRLRAAIDCPAIGMMHTHLGAISLPDLACAGGGGNTQRVIVAMHSVKLT